MPFKQQMVNLQSIIAEANKGRPSNVADHGGTWANRNFLQTPQNTVSSSFTEHTAPSTGNVAQQTPLHGIPRSSRNEHLAWAQQLCLPCPRRDHVLPKMGCSFLPDRKPFSRACKVMPSDKQKTTQQENYDYGHCSCESCAPGCRALLGGLILHGVRNLLHLKPSGLVVDVIFSSFLTVSKEVLYSCPSLDKNCAQPFHNSFRRQ